MGAIQTIWDIKSVPNENDISIEDFFYSSGFSTESKNDTATKTTVDLAMIPNLNWLIHMAFARQDYKYCIEVIEYQFNETYDHEYLYYIKVSSIR